MDKSTEAIFWLKEFSKSWIYNVSDVMVYSRNIGSCDADDIFRIIGASGTYIEKYLNLDLWLEIFFKVRRQGEFVYYVALIEACESKISGKKFIRESRSNPDFIYSRDNDAMFINNIYSTKNRKGMPMLLPVRSVIRLHRLNISSGILSELFELVGESRFVLDEDWELNSFVLHNGKRISDVIKSRTELVKNLSDKDAQIRRKGFSEIRVADVASILQVIVNIDMIGITCGEGSDFTVEGIKMFLRPDDSAEGPSHWLHILSPCE